MNAGIAGIEQLTPQLSLPECLPHRFEGLLQVLASGGGGPWAVHRAGLLAGLAGGRLLVRGLGGRRRHLLLVLFLGDFLKVLVHGLRHLQGR